MSTFIKAFSLSLILSRGEMSEVSGLSSLRDYMSYSMTLDKALHKFVLSAYLNILLWHVFGILVRSTSIMEHHVNTTPPATIRLIFLPRGTKKIETLWEAIFLSSRAGSPFRPPERVSMVEVTLKILSGCSVTICIDLRWHCFCSECGVRGYAANTALYPQITQIPLQQTH